MNINKQIIITTILLLISIYIFGATNIDFMIQNHLYNFNTHTWLLNRDAEPYRFIFYIAAKKIIIIFGLILLFSVIFLKNNFVKTHKKGMIVVILSLIFVPVIVGFLKKETNMPCPKNEIHYGGTMPKTAVWKSYKIPYNQMPKIKCWPAGHASGGFALMSLYFLFRKKRNKILGLIFGFTMGWIMGIYKMFIGDHFFSHNIITMLLAWLIILIIAKFIKIKNF